MDQVQIIEAIKVLGQVVDGNNRGEAGPYGRESMQAMIDANVKISELIKLIKP